MNFTHAPVRLFLVIGLPALLALCFLTAPFEVSDEAHHLDRVASLLNGVLVPTTSSHDVIAGGEMKSAGGNIDANLADMTERFVPQKRRATRLSVAEWQTQFASRSAGRDRYSGFSNTAIYPPILYVGGMIGAGLAQVAALPLLCWLYAARLANIALTAAMIVWSLRRGRDAALVMLAIALLPQTMFQIASVSADALLIGFAFMFAAGMLALLVGARECIGDTRLLALATFCLCAGKVAYMPLAILPPLAARVADGRWSGRAKLHLATLAMTVIAWAVWSRAIAGKVFTIVPAIHVDPAAQLHFLLGQPVRGITILAGAMVRQAPKLLIGVPGARLGWQDLVLDKPFVVLSCAIVVATAVVAMLPERRRLLPSMVAVGMCVTCYPIIFLLLYLQFNAIGAPTVNGVLPRYLLPLLLVALAATPRLALSARNYRVAVTVVGIWGIASATLTCASVTRHYWSA